jgi:3-oxoacyl-[acyl-carrier-protein] synthase II
LLGGAGALEAVITVMALRERRVPPNAHCMQPDPACAVPLVPVGGLDMPALNAAVSSSFAFGGTNSALLFARA